MLLFRAAAWLCIRAPMFYIPFLFFTYHLHASLILPMLYSITNPDIDIMSRAGAWLCIRAPLFYIPASLPVRVWACAVFTRLRELCVYSGVATPSKPRGCGYARLVSSVCVCACGWLSLDYRSLSLHLSCRLYRLR